MRLLIKPPSASAETGDASIIWEGHKAGRHIGYCHLEKLHNLEPTRHRFHGELLPAQNTGCFGRLDPRSRHR